MPLNKGAAAPNFRLQGTGAQQFHLQDHKGQPFIIYFFPRSYTPGCTAEACSFRDHYPLFNDQGIHVLGITQDSVETLDRFRQSLSLPFHLLSDRQGTVARLYQATVPLLNVTRRITYFIDDQHVVQGVYADQFNALLHFERILQFVRNRVK